MVFLFEDSGVKKEKGKKKENLFMSTQNNKKKKIILSALFIAIGVILPFFTMQVPAIGNMLLPMHIPVILCGFICGGPYGLIVGVLTPIIRSLLIGMPVMVPTAVCMAIELGTYGLLTGILYQKVRDRKGGIYISLIISMLAGRIVWGVASFFIYQLLGNAFTWKIFAMQAFMNAIPGIILQLLLIPLLVSRLKIETIEHSI